METDQIRFFNSSEPGVDYPEETVSVLIFRVVLRLGTRCLLAILGTIMLVREYAKRNRDCKYDCH